MLKPVEFFIKALNSSSGCFAKIIVSMTSLDSANCLPMKTHINPIH